MWKNNKTVAYSAFGFAVGVVCGLVVVVGAALVIKSVFGALPPLDMAAQVPLVIGGFGLMSGAVNGWKSDRNRARLQYKRDSAELARQMKIDAAIAAEEEKDLLDRERQRTEQRRLEREAEAKIEAIRRADRIKLEESSFKSSWGEYDDND